MKKIFWNFIASSILLLLLQTKALATSISIPLDNIGNLDSFSKINKNADGSYSNNYGKDISLSITDDSSNPYVTVVITQDSYFNVVETASASFTIYENGNTLAEIINGQVSITDIPDPYTESVASTIDTHISNDIIQDTIIDNTIAELPQSNTVIDNEIQEEYKPHDIELANIDTDLYTQDNLFIQVRKQQSKLLDIEFEDEEVLEDSKAFEDLVGNDIIAKYIIAKAKLEVEINKLKEQLNDKTN